MATLKVKDGRFWKPDEEITEDDIKKGFILDSSHKCKDCIELPPEPKWFDKWWKSFWKYHRRL